MTIDKKREIIEEAFNYYHDRTALNNKEEKELLNFVNELYEAISVTRCCTELKTVKQGENLILDNKFDVQVVIPESSVLIKHKEKDRLIWIDKQRLKRN